MNTLVKDYNYFLAVDISFTEEHINLILSDGREVKTPLVFYPRLVNATKKQLENFRFLGGGEGIHWPDLDEDLSVEGIVLGRKAV